MKKMIAALAGAVALLAGAAWAGKVTTSQVVVDSVNQSAWGAVRSARSSADNFQFMRCFTDYTPGVGTSMGCQAQNATGQQGACYSADPEFVALARSVNDTSYVIFFWDANGYCTRMRLMHSSEFR